MTDTRQRGKSTKQKGGRKKQKSKKCEGRQKQRKRNEFFRIKWKGRPQVARGVTLLFDATFLYSATTRPHHGGQRRRTEDLVVCEEQQGQQYEQKEILRGREWTKTRRVRNLGRVQKASVLVPERAAQGKYYILSPRPFLPLRARMRRSLMKESLESDINVLSLSYSY